jgi:uncharacterized membrane protein
MAAGYGLGPVLLLDSSRRRKLLLALGLCLTSAFIILRWNNGYGDPSPWQSLSDPERTLMSFLNCEKYPPSLLYLLMTLGPLCMALAYFDRPLGPLGRRVVIFGRVPMFFYLLHLPLIHSLAAVAAYARHGPDILKADHLPENYGYGLPVVYLAWIIVLLILYPACRWFAGVKARRRDWWLGYL